MSLSDGCLSSADSSRSLFGEAKLVKALPPSPRQDYHTTASQSVNKGRLIVSSAPSSELPLRRLPCRDNSLTSVFCRLA